MLKIPTPQGRRAPRLAALLLAMAALAHGARLGALAPAGTIVGYHPEERDLRPILVEHLTPGADLSGAEFLPGADLAGAPFERVNLAGARFGLAPAGSRWLPVDLHGARFIDCDLGRAEFPGALLAKAGFSRCDLTRSAFPEADLAEAGFDRCDLSLAAFADALMGKASFTDCTMDGTRFPDAFLRGAEFTGGLWDGPRFTRTDLTDATFTGVRMVRPDFSYANLTRAEFLRTLVSQVVETGTVWAATLWVDGKVRNPAKAAGIPGRPDAVPPLPQRAMAGPGAGAGLAAPAAEAKPVRQSRGWKGENIQRWDDDLARFEAHIQAHPGQPLARDLHHWYTNTQAMANHARKTRGGLDFQRNLDDGRTRRFLAAEQQYCDGRLKAAGAASAKPAADPGAAATSWASWEKSCNQFEAWVNRPNASGRPPGRQREG